MQEKFDEFLEEVQNDIRQEKYMRIWEQYGKIISSAVTGVIVLVAAFTLWQNYSHKKQLELSDKFLHAQNYMYQGKFDEAVAIFDSMGTSNTKVYGYLRDFQKAAILLASSDAEKHAQATKIYEEAMANSSLPQSIRDLARLLFAKVGIAAGKTVEDTRKVLEPLLVEGQSWRFFALEMISEMQFKAGEIEKSLEGFAEIARSTNVPEGIMLRAQLMVQVANGALKN